jgi:hypothetical protein
MAGASDRGKAKRGAVTVLTREEWLVSVVAQIEERMIYPLLNLRLPPHTLTCGYTKSQKASTALSLQPELSANGKWSTYVAPELDDSELVVAKLCHEAIHYLAGPTHSYNKRHLAMDPLFPQYHHIDDIVKTVGPYPHKAVYRSMPPSSPIATTTWQSPQQETYRLTIRTELVLKYGKPRDPWGNFMHPVKADDLFNPQDVSKQVGTTYPTQGFINENPGCFPRPHQSQASRRGP